MNTESKQLKNTSGIFSLLISRIDILIVSMFGTSLSTYIKIMVINNFCTSTLFIIVLDHRWHQIKVGSYPLLTKK